MNKKAIGLTRCWRSFFALSISLIAFLTVTFGLPNSAMAQGNLGAPQLVSPTQNQTLTNYPRDAKLVWNSVSGATYYEVEIACDWCSNLSIKYDNPSVVNLQGTSYLYTAPGDNQYRWRVRAGNVNGPGLWTDYFYFKYDTSNTTVSLSAPQIKSPYNNQVLTNYPRNLDLSWSPVSGANGYEIEISCDWCTTTSSKFAKVETYTAQGTIYPYSPVGDNQYQWRVRAIGGPWSNHSYFKFDTSGYNQTKPKIGVPKLIYPANNAVVTDYPRWVTFQWGEVGGANGYEIEITCDYCDSAEKFGKPKVFSSRNTEHTYTLAGDNEYRWRVHANGGEYSDYFYLKSDTSSYNQGGEYVQPPAPRLIYPRNNAILTQYPREVKFEWEPISGVSEYVIEISCDHCGNNGKFGSPETYISNTPYYYYTLAGDNEYRWRVWAANGKTSDYRYLKSDTSGYNQPEVRKYAPGDAPDVCGDDIQLYLEGAYRFCAGSTITDSRGAKFFITNEVDSNAFTLLDLKNGATDLKLYKNKAKELLDNRYGELDVSYFDHEWGNGRLWIYLRFDWNQSNSNYSPASQTPTPSRDRCRFIKKLWDQGDFTARFGHLRGELFPCKDAYYSGREWDKDTSDYALMTRCAKIKGLHDKYGAATFSSKFKTEAKEAEKCQKEVYGKKWWSSTSGSGNSNQGIGYVRGEEPPAGYEDEVRTNFDQNPFSDTVLEKLEGLAAAELYERAIIGGYPDGEFKGDRPVNRAELAKFLLLARFGTITTENNNGKFKDVKEGEWYVRFVMMAFRKGIISGYADGNFKPGHAVNTAEFLKMLSKTFGLDDSYSHNYSDVPSGAWYEAYAGVAARYNLFPDRESRLEPARELTRNEVAVAIYQYLKNR